MAVYAGLPTDNCGATWLPVFVARLATFGIRVRFTQLIGTYAASGNTHGSGAAFDLVVVDPGSRSFAAAYAIVVREARQMGADATWKRPYNWDLRGGILHVHGLLNGCLHLTVAGVNQQVAVRAGLNGLANHAADTGPRPLSGRTWRQGIAWAHAGGSTTKGILGMSKLRILTRSKGISVKKMQSRVVPLENKYTGASSALIPATGDIDFLATFDLSVTGIPKGSRVLVRAVHDRNGKIVGASGWQDIVGTGGKASYGVLTHHGSVAKGRKLRLQVYSPFADTTVTSIKTRVRYGR